MLVVAPLVILLIGVIIGFMTTITGDSLATSKRGAITYGAQQALDTLENDIRLTSGFLDSSGALPSQQYPPYGGNTFTTPDALILEQNATSDNPHNNYRELIHFRNQPYACGPKENLNERLRVRIVYFVHDNTLYKRTIVPEYSSSTTAANSVCETPWQRNSCSEGYDSSTICQTRDEKIATNVTSFSVEYYENPSDSTTTSEITNASSVRIEIETEGSAAGRLSDFRGAIRATKLNPKQAPLESPSEPVINSAQSGPTTATFSWLIPDNSTFYDATYGINSQPCTQNVALSNSRDSYFDVSSNHGDTVNFCLTAKNIIEESSTASVSHTIPVWAAEKMVGGWQNYSSQYNGFGYTKAHNGEVFLRGLVKRSSTTFNSGSSVIATLPPGYRPSVDLIFNTTAYRGSTGGSNVVNASAMIRVYKDGRIAVRKDNAEHDSSRWISLANIKFMPAGSCTFSDLSLNSGWANWGGGYPNESVCIDSTERAHVRGMVKKSSSSYTPSNWETIGSIADNQYGPLERHIISARGWGKYAPFDINKHNTTQMKTVYRPFADYSNYSSHLAAYYTQNYTGAWHPISLQNGWQNWGSGYAQARCTVNGRIVTIHGLIKNGVDSNGTTIGFLPLDCPAPSHRDIYSAVAYDGPGNLRHARVDVYKESGPLGRGVIRLVAHGSNLWTSLGDISYVIE